jgi:hypothetical protein
VIDLDCVLPNSLFIVEYPQAKKQRVHFGSAGTDERRPPIVVRETSALLNRQVHGTGDTNTSRPLFEGRVRVRVCYIDIFFSAMTQKRRPRIPILFVLYGDKTIVDNVDGIRTTSLPRLHNPTLRRTHKADDATSAFLRFRRKHQSGDRQQWP